MVKKTNKQNQNPSLFQVHALPFLLVSEDVTKTTKVVLQEEYHTMLLWILTTHLKLVYLINPIEICEEEDNRAVSLERKASV